jgi:hypothetical protein
MMMEDMRIAPMIPTLPLQLLILIITIHLLPLPLRLMG